MARRKNCIGISWARTMPPDQPYYSIHTTKQYRRDLKRMKKSGRYDFQKLDAVVDMLAREWTLPHEYYDHPLQGEWADRRECHIQGDWVLVYRKEHDKLILSLMRTGRHTDVFEE